MSEDEVGGVAEEAAKLLAALQAWARDAGRAATGEPSGEPKGTGGDPGSGASTASGIGDRLHDISDHIGHGPDCVYCPICQTINFVRETSPEAKQKVVSAAATLMASLVELVSAAFPQPGSSAEPEPGVERIDLTDDGWDES